MCGTELKVEEAKAPPVATSSASKLKLSALITELELYGDARVRYEVRSGETAAPDPINPAGDTYQRNRARYRLRLGLRGTLLDDWFFGVRLETSTNPRSTNVTVGDDTSAGPGPFAKNSDSVNVGQAYFGYQGIKGLKLTAGKMANPFVTSSMVWDGDINPEGLAEQYKYTIKLGADSPAASQTTTDKDGKAVVTETAAPVWVRRLSSSLTSASSSTMIPIQTTRLVPRSAESRRQMPTFWPGRSARVITSRRTLTSRSRQPFITIPGRRFRVSPPPSLAQPAPNDGVTPRPPRNFSSA